jgi:hypothetical protein
VRSATTHGNGLWEQLANSPLIYRTLRGLCWDKQSSPFIEMARKQSERQNKNLKPYQGLKFDRTDTIYGSGGSSCRSHCKTVGGL